MRKKITTVILILVALAIFAQMRSKKNAIKMAETFYFSNISGELERIEVSTGTVYITVKGVEYGFWPMTNDLNSNNIFSHTAKIGDSIIKDTKSDILKLRKGGNIYKYKNKKLK